MKKRENQAALLLILTSGAVMAAALPLEALPAFGRWLRDLSLSGPAGNLAAWGIALALTALPALALCAALGGWFPVDNAGAWVTFVAIYLVTMAAITAGYTLHYRRTAGSFDAALARYREGRGE